MENFTFEALTPSGDTLIIEGFSFEPFRTNELKTEIRQKHLEGYSSYTLHESNGRYDLQIDFHLVDRMLYVLLPSALLKNTFGELPEVIVEPTMSFDEYKESVALTLEEEYGFQWPNDNLADESLSFALIDGQSPSYFAEEFAGELGLIGIGETTN